MMVTARIKVDCAIEPDVFEEFCEIAATGGHYWLREADIEIDEDTDVLSFVLQADSDTEPVILHQADIERALGKLLTDHEQCKVSSDLAEEVAGLIMSDCFLDIDPGDAEKILQIAAFSEVIYG